MKYLLFVVVLALGACGLAGEPKLSEKQQRALEDKTLEVQTFLEQTQKEANLKSARKSRELENFKEGVLGELKLDPSKYRIEACGSKFVILDQNGKALGTKTWVWGTNK